MLLLSILLDVRVIVGCDGKGEEDRDEGEEGEGVLRMDLKDDRAMAPWTRTSAR